MTLQYPTIADCVGNTPLVRLQRLPGATSNTLLLKLEGVGKSGPRIPGGRVNLRLVADDDVANDDAIARRLAPTVEAYRPQLG